MILWFLVILIMTAAYSWMALWALGYHGVFLLILLTLWILTYCSLWKLYLIWLWNTSSYYEIFNWVEMGNQILIDFELNENFESLILLFIMSIGSLVVLTFVYVEMWDDKEGVNFAIELLLFVMFMGILVCSDNLLIFYLGWEGMGLTSLFLMNFWNERASGFKATFKVYIMNKIGDFLLTMGICLIMGMFGNLDFSVLNFFSFFCSALVQNFFSISLVDLMSVLFVLGGGVKSAQWGFHIWLLEAMEAPLGASALMHSSTLVVAGIMLVFKLFDFISQSSTALLLLTYWGLWTAWFGAFNACFQYELKMVLAYSTISSMGFIYMLLGLENLNCAFLYLVIHAFMKIYLFLIIGAIIFYCNGCQDMSWMGSFYKTIPTLFVLYTVGALSMGGMPYFSGYYCKAGATHVLGIGNKFFINLYFMNYSISFLTYLYLMRMWFLVFFGESRALESLYTLRFNSMMMICFFCMLGLFVVYGGPIWVNFINNFETSIFSYIFKDSLYQLSEMNFITMGEWEVMFMFLSFFIFLLYFYLLKSRNFNYWFLFYWFSYFMILFIMSMMWVCL